MIVSDRLQGSITRGVGYFFPPVCVFCSAGVDIEADRAEGLPDIRICRHCLSALPLRRISRLSCLSNPYPDDPIPDFSVISAFFYEDPIPSAILSLKFGDATYFVRALSYFLSQAVRRDGAAFDCIIPVPLAAKRLRERGYNQAERIARDLSEDLSIPLVPSFLERTRETRQQSSVTANSKRAENVRGAFSVPADVSVSGLSILLVDDILTTGHTLHEAALALFRAGAGSVTGAAVSSGRLREQGGRALR